MVDAAGTAVARDGMRLGARLELLRIRQWTKNAFVVAPLFFAKQLNDADAVLRVALALVAFCAASSLVYLLNDWTDRRTDARHPTKSRRPLASGALNGGDAAVQSVFLLLILGGASLTLADRPSALVPIGVYLLLNVAYSTWLRSVNLLDVTIIASGFVLRVVAGAGAVGVPPSSWIVLCTGLLALLLGLGKRRGDLGLETAAERPTLDHYNLAFIDLALGILAAAVITFYALFTVSEYSATRFHSEYLYLTTFPVALAILRYLQVLLEGSFSGSPTEIVLRDRTVQLLTVGWLVLFAAVGDIL